MRKYFVIAAGAVAMILGSISITTSEAQAQPYGYGGYRRPPPPRHYAPRPAYRPVCAVRSERIWNGYRHVWVQRRVCR